MWKSNLVVKYLLFLNYIEVYVSRLFLLNQILKNSLSKQILGYELTEHYLPSVEVVWYIQDGYWQLLIVWNKMVSCFLRKSRFLFKIIGSSNSYTLWTMCFSLLWINICNLVAFLNILIIRFCSTMVNVSKCCKRKITWNNWKVYRILDLYFNFYPMHKFPINILSTNWKTYWDWALHWEFLQCAINLPGPSKNRLKKVSGKSVKRFRRLLKTNKQTYKH